VASFFAAGGDGFDIKGKIIEHTLTGNAQSLNIHLI
jgi:hypothetical protein